jgi:hypothetical protein
MRPKSTGSKRTASADAVSKSRNASRNGARKYPFLALCVRNDRDAISLQKGKAYRVIKPLANDPPSLIRVIDEENEDYLYPAAWFVPIQIPPASKKNVWRAVSTVDV